MSAARRGSPAGSPSTIAVRRGPWDSPAVIQRSRDMRRVTYTTYTARTPRVRHEAPLSALMRSRCEASRRAIFLRRMRLLASFARFEKYEGLGNDFVVVDAANEEDVTSDLARNLCDRRR